MRTTAQDDTPELRTDGAADILGLPMPLNCTSQLKRSFLSPFNPILPSFGTNASVPQLAKVFCFPIRFKFSILRDHFNLSPTLSGPILTVHYRQRVRLVEAGRRCDQETSVMSN